MSNILFVASKQISYLMYDDNKHELVAHYVTGETKCYHSVSASWYNRLQQSENQYDEFILLTQSLLETSSS
ncbi:hypothetical protein [Paenibacillus sp. 481]|uniref:hypothetical protein n=1 Tax=Paenibacillus sp. 481 TaxID=2835869 RepID=UPI001E5233DB|nr:hypothetical protein [Paenibacillus sp. 481]UHA72274.1 hypothetical protein KIK04_16485 [Paenibacillus sp. 481]